MHLTDLLVYVAVSGLLLGGTFLLLEQGQQVYETGAARVDAQQGVRLALERMAAEIRGAGFSRDGAAFSAIAVAEPTRLVIQHDLNGDGVIDGPGETITYVLRETTLRRDAGGGAQPVLNNVRQLRFTYLDGDRNETAEADRVRSVAISIAAAAGHTTLTSATAPVATATTEVRLRNR